MEQVSVSGARAMWVLNISGPGLLILRVHDGREMII